MEKFLARNYNFSRIK